MADDKKQQQSKSTSMWDDLSKTMEFAKYYVGRELANAYAPYALKAYRAYKGEQQLAPSERFYMAALADKSPLITEQNLSPSQQDILAEAILRKHSKNPEYSKKQSGYQFGYTDYSATGIGTLSGSPGQELTSPIDFHNALGRFTYNIDPQTEDIIVQDTYDFQGDPKKAIGEFYSSLLKPLSAKTPANLIRSYANMNMSQQIPGAGVPVRIRIKSPSPALVDYNRPGYDTGELLNPRSDLR